MAILFRTNEQPRAFETELRKAKMPYVLIGGMSFFDRKEVRDTIAYLKVLDQPSDDVSLLRICNTPPRGIGQKAITLLMEEALRQGRPLWDMLARARQSSSLPEATLQSIDGFRSLIERFRQQLGDVPLAELATNLLRTVQYEQEVQRQCSNPDEQASRWRAVEEIVNALAAYEKKVRKPTLSDFLDDIALADRDFDNQQENQLRRNVIALMTLHSRQGPGVLASVHGGHGGRNFASSSQHGRRDRDDRRRAAALLRRHHTGPEPTDAVAVPQPDEMGQAPSDGRQPLSV